MKKEHFCELIYFIKERIESGRELTKALQKYTGDKDFTGFWASDTFYPLSVWLAKVLNDKDEWISWWMWEDDFGKGGLIIEVDGQPKQVNTAEELYDAMEIVYGWR